ncbi:MAG: hypothetical protein JNK82_14480, partial [Myxococcaceae bacterium]|nr:hypothetical protein [Myxococcaceae bacterium]
QALALWPENPVARRGLQRAGEASVRFEVAQRNGAGARAALMALVERSNVLAEQVAALESDLAAQAKARAALDSLLAAAGTRVGAWTRALIGAALMYALGVVSLVLGRAGVQLSYAMLFWSFGSGLVLHSVALVLTRRRSLANRQG